MLLTLMLIHSEYLIAVIDLKEFCLPFSLNVLVLVFDNWLDKKEIVRVLEFLRYSLLQATFD
jgi:hypothetical protein